MSKIDKLSVYGIRSFAPATEYDSTGPANRVQPGEAIKFHTPLTLIVGYNGSGKTTIIECLKYATTGDMPPNTKGGAFVHDPALVSEREVKGQVKISFRATSGAKMVCTRNLQLTVKKATRSLKTLEGNLLMMRNGERVSVSSRVAELDQMMPQYLGVSKAILDNVIFCHQDESLWPMSEPSALKKKFDEIFEALKYTKAIDNIKVLRKKQNEELGKYKIIEQHAKEDKDKGDRAEKKANELAAQIEVLREKSDKLVSDRDEAQRKASEANDKMATFEVTVSALYSKRNEANTKQSNIEELRHNIKRMLPDSDEDLVEQLHQHDEVVKSHEEEYRAVEQEYQEVSAEINDRRADLNEKQSNHGRLQAQRERYDEQIVQRETLVKETAQRHEIRGFDSQLDDAKISEFMNRIARMAQDQRAAFERTRREFSKELKEAQVKLQEYNGERSVSNSTKESLRSQITVNDRKSRDLQSQHDQIDFDEGSKAQIDSSLQALTERLTTAEAEADNSKWDSQIQSGEKRLRDLKSKADEFKQELFQVQERSKEAAQIDLLNKQARDNQGSLDTMKGAHGERLTAVLGREWMSGDLEAVYQRTLETQSKKIIEAEQKREVVNAEYKEINFKFTSMNENLAQKSKELQAASERLGHVVNDGNPASYPNDLENAERDRDERKSTFENAQVMHDHYTKIDRLLKEKECCGMCRRGFKKGSTDMAEFRERLDHLLKSTSAEQAEEALEDAEATLAEFRQVSGDYETWKRLSSELPSLKREASQLQPRLKQLLRDVESQDESLSDLKSTKRGIEGLSRTIQNMIKYQRDAGNAEKSLKDLVMKTSQTQSTRSLDDIKEDSDKVDQEIASTQSTLGKTNAERERSRTLINQLQMEVQEARSKLDRADFQLKEKRALSANIEEILLASRKARDQIRATDQRLEELGQKIAEASARCDDIATRQGEAEEQLRGTSQSLESSVNEFRLAERDIRNFIDQGGMQQLDRSKVEIERTREDIQRLEARQKQFAKKLDSLKEKMTNQGGVRDNLSQNIRFRQQRRQMDTLKNEIQELEDQNAEHDRSYWDREGRKWQDAREGLATELTGISAEAKALDRQLSQLIKDWETDYRDAAYKYKESHIRVETTKAAIEDLGRYGGALDRAIMQYHTIKMEEINRILEELWKKTYRGSDVDTVLIRSDNETGKGNKSYNYRVCMVKGEVEMDMRGRCSAGQRVLASILIRLALAEVFSSGCGFIALDEPTTNLDRDNIISLAQSLHDIIAHRAGHNSFQMAIITHDSEFLKAMQCADFCDDYYRVSRNAAQQSEIRMIPIGELMD